MFPKVIKEHRAIRTLGILWRGASQILRGPANFLIFPLFFYSPLNFYPTSFVPSREAHTINNFHQRALYEWTSLLAICFGTKKRGFLLSFEFHLFWRADILMSGWRKAFDLWCRLITRQLHLTDKEWHSIIPWFTISFTKKHFWFVPETRIKSNT